MSRSPRRQVVRAAPNAVLGTGSAAWGLNPVVLDLIAGYRVCLGPGAYPLNGFSVDSNGGSSGVGGGGSAMAAIREAREGDSAGIAQVIVQTWRSAYSGIVPDDVLAAMSVEGTTGHCDGWLAQDREVGRSMTFVGEADEQRIVGVARVVEPGDPEPGYERELRVLYVLDAFQGQGIGRRLIRAATERLAEQGITTLTVPVFAANALARGFYEALGASPIRTMPMEFSRFSIDGVLYGWTDTAHLRSWPEPGDAFAR